MIIVVVFSEIAGAQPTSNDVEVLLLDVLHVFDVHDTTFPIEDVFSVLQLLSVYVEALIAVVDDEEEALSLLEELFVKVSAFEGENELIVEGSVEALSFGGNLFLENQVLFVGVQLAEQLRVIVQVQRQRILD